MTDILKKTIVLVLNRNWQAINIRTPQEAFCMMATNVATGLEIESENHIRPVTWDEWITLPIREGDNAVRTVRGAIRVPTVIVAVNYARVPKKRPKLCARTIRERDGNHSRKPRKQDFFDVEHAVVGGAYADIFVTSDGNLFDLLTRRCSISSDRGCRVMRGVKGLEEALIQIAK